MTSVENALKYLARQAYIGVGQTSTDFRTDYGRVTSVVTTLAAALGIDYRVPDYVTEIIGSKKEECRD